MESKNLKHPLEPEEDFEIPKKKSRNTDNDHGDGTDINSSNDKSFGAFFLRESDVGITEYISKLPGFNAIIKERYSDFIVNELDSKGNVLKLTDTSVPKNSTSISNTLLSDDQIERLRILNDADNDDNTTSVIINVNNMTKDERKDVHLYIRKIFINLKSKTEDSADGKCIAVVKKKDERIGRPFDCSQGGNYVHFLMYKENLDTMSAIGKIGHILRINTKTFSYAGTKDKRGKTVQAVSAYRVEPKVLARVNNAGTNLRVGNFSFQQDKIDLGDLFGNRFIIVLRQLQGNLDHINESMSLLSSNGFINYYGMQRFGTTSIPTHHIGRALLLKKWSEAIDLILSPRIGGTDHEAYRKVWIETHDAKKSLKKIRGRKSSIEFSLLTYLSRNSTDLVNALNQIPRNMRLMYIHSYQSYIWNKVVSRRIAKHGLNVLPGDLFFPKKEETFNNEEMMSPETLKHVTNADVDQEGLIHDVVLPLPGHKITYPDNEIASWYEEFLKEDGMDFDSFKSSVKCYALSGSYRKIVVEPIGLQWEVIPYNDNTIPLALSDWDILQKLTIPSPPPTQEAKYKALRMEFKLPSSSYATMAIREITKSDTGVAAQKAMSTS